MVLHDAMEAQNYGSLSGEFAGSGAPDPGLEQIFREYRTLYESYTPTDAQKTIIHCNVDELHINKMYPTAQAVIGDARLTLQALRQEVSDRTSGAGRTAGNVAAEVRAARHEALARYRQVMVSDEKLINPYRVYGDLMEVLDLRNSFVTHESGNTRDQQSATSISAVSRRGRPITITGI